MNPETRLKFIQGAATSAIHQIEGNDEFDGTPESSVGYMCQLVKERFPTTEQLAKALRAFNCRYHAVPSWDEIPDHHKQIWLDRATETQKLLREV